MRSLPRLWRLRASFCGAPLLLLLANWFVVCWYHISTTTTAHGDETAPAAGNRSRSLRLRSRIRDDFLSGSFRKGQLSQARRLEAEAAPGQERAMNDAPSWGSEAGNSAEEDDQNTESSAGNGNDDDDGEDSEQFFHNLRPSDYKASSLLSRAWVPMPLRSGAYTTHRWRAEELRAFEAFQLPTRQANACRTTSECRNVTCPSVSAPRSLGSTSAHNTPPAGAPTCKILWTTGWLLKEPCDQELLNYSVALATARYFAPETIQPMVLLAVAKPGLPLGRVVRHLTSQGVIVVQLGQLSFHDFVADWHDRGNLSMEVEDLVLPYWALAVPRILAAHDILTLKKVCQRHVLVTDPNFHFVNPITAADVHSLQSQLGPETDAFLAFDANATSSSNPTSRLSYPSVYFMDAARFEQHWPEMLQLRHGSNAIASVDEWLSAYFDQDDRHASYRGTLPLAWRWLPSRDSAMMRSFIKLARYDSGSEVTKQTAHCNVTNSESRQAICCDDVRTLTHSMNILAKHLAPDRQTICPDQLSSTQDDIIDDDDTDDIDKSV